MCDRKCERCGEQFKAKTADVKRGWARFCSKSCKAKTQTPKASAAKQSEMPQWLRDDLQFEVDMDGATGGWDEGGWLSDDSGVEHV